MTRAAPEAILRFPAVSMHSLSMPVQHARAHHRHNLRTLTYVVIDESNGGIVRNLNQEGVAVQAVAELQSGQVVRVRFDLRHPRLRIEARGEVMWANSSGQCGIRFLDLPRRMIRQVNEWIFGNILEGMPQDSTCNGPIFGPADQAAVVTIVDDGLVVSPTARKVIQLEPRAADELRDEAAEAALLAELPPATDWLSKPLSRRSLAWTVDALVMIAAFLLFALVFLSVAHELPKWPQSLAVGLGTAVFIPAFYWGFLYLFGGPSLGARLAKLANSRPQDEEEESEAPDPFR